MDGLVQIGGRRSRTMDDERAAHFFYERVLRTIGVVYVLGGALFSLSAVGAAADAPGRADLMAVGVVLLSGGLVGVVGFGLFRLSSHALIPSLLLGAAGLVGFAVFPIRAVLGGAVPAAVLALSIGGVCLHALMVGVLVHPAGRAILSPRYAEVLSVTDRMRAGPSYWVWAIVGASIAAAVTVV